MIEFINRAKTWASHGLRALDSETEYYIISQTEIHHDSTARMEREDEIFEIIQVPNSSAEEPAPNLDQSDLFGVNPPASYGGVQSGSVMTGLSASVYAPPKTAPWRGDLKFPSCARDWAHGPEVFEVLGDLMHPYASRSPHMAAKAINAIYLSALVKSSQGRSLRSRATADEFIEEFCELLWEVVVQLDGDGVEQDFLVLMVRCLRELQMFDMDGDLVWGKLDALHSLGMDVLEVGIFEGEERVNLKAFVKRLRGGTSALPMVESWSLVENLSGLEI